MLYYQYQFYTREEGQRDFLIALLGEVGFEGFEELHDSVIASISERDRVEQEINLTLAANGLDHLEVVVTTVSPRNWNEDWERSFSAVLIADRVGVRAPFHSAMNTEYELVIEPKMSFGTGHHPTTTLMVQTMLEVDFVGKTVLDFGSGTGILAILAEQLGAASITAIDNEDWAIENSRENILRNNSVHVTVIPAAEMHLGAMKFDVILANINRNVILECIAGWRQQLAINGLLMVSGILAQDEKDIVESALQVKLIVERQLALDGWLCIVFKTNP